MYYFSIGGKFQPVSNLTELHTLTPAARSYAFFDPVHVPATIDFLHLITVLEL